MKKTTLIIHKIIKKIGIDNTIAKFGNRIPFLYKFIPLHNMYKKNSELMCFRDGVCFNLDKSDYMQWHVFANLPENSWKIASELSVKDAVVFDVGSNIGVFSLKLSKIFRDFGYSNSKIFAFEPNPDISKKFYQNINLNPDLAPFVIVIESALSDEVGEMQLNICDDNTGASTLVESNKSGKSVSVKVSTIDEIVSKYNLLKVDFIKIDVEGFEPFVIKGSKDTISKHKPILYIEMTNEWFKKNGYCNKDIVCYLAKFGYKFYISTETKLKEIDFMENINEFHQFDLITIPKDR